MSSNERNINLFGSQCTENDPSVYLAETPFVSIQGEGPNIGKNTLFIRFFGCNLSNTCGKDWCDVKHSFYTREEIKKDEFGQKIFAAKPDRLTFANVEQMYESIFELNGLAKFNNVVLTGGEPMLQQFQIATLLRLFRDTYKRTITVEIETNGTIPVETEYIDWFRMAHFNISPKVHTNSNFSLLSQLKNCRGVEDGRYIAFDHTDWIVKFVYQGKESLEKIKACLETHDITENERVYLMPEGTTRKEQINRMKECVEYCINTGYNFTPRLHVIVWDHCKGI